jgi:chromosome transmission fidelity protein 18
MARQARYRAGNPQGSAEEFIFDDKENANSAKDDELPAIPVKKDFFGRVIRTDVQPLSETNANSAHRKKTGSSNKPLGKAETKVWVTYHEGMNNAVRKPITLDELLRGL